MNETPQDKRHLQLLVDRSIDRAGSILKKSFQMPQNSLTAEQIINKLQGLQIVSLATTTVKGEPRVAPIGAIFYRGSYFIPTVATAARTKQIRHQSAVSLTQYEGVDFAIIIHGDANIISPEQAQFNDLDELHKQLTGGSVTSWGEGVYLQVIADRFFTFARFPEKFS